MVTTKGINICIVPVYQDSRSCLAQRLRQQVRRPEDPILSCPCFLRVSIQPMYENNIYNSLRMGINFGNFESFDFVGFDSSALVALGC